MNRSSTPSSESLWAGDFVVSVIDDQTRTHNDSSDSLFDSAANEKAFGHVGLLLTWKYINVRTRNCAQRATHLSTILAKKWYHFVTRARRKRNTFVSKVSDVHGPILSVGCFTEMYDDRTAWFANKNAFLRFEGRHEVERMKQNRHWRVKCSYLRSCQSPSVWKGRWFLVDRSTG